MAQLQSLADAPGNQREYETIMIVHPNTQNDGVASLNDRLKTVIEGEGGTVLKVDNWGKRRLAYEIKNELRGIYLYWQFLGTPGLVDELERTLRLIDGVLRYQTVRIDEDVDPNARPSEMDDEAYARAAETAADEEDLMTSSNAGEGEAAAAGEEGEGEGEGAEASAEGAEASAEGAADEEASEAASGDTAEAEDAGGDAAGDDSGNEDK